MGGLENAEAVLFSSGMAAAAAVLITQVKPGSVIAMDSGCYHGVRALAETYIAPNGVELRLARPAELAAASDGADLLWLESPSNPMLEVYDIAALAAIFLRGGGVDEQPRGFDLRCHFGKLDLDCLVLRDRLAEGVALLRVFDGFLECRSGDTQPASGDVQALGFEPSHDLLETLAFFSAD